MKNQFNKRHVVRLIGLSSSALTLLSSQMFGFSSESGAATRTVAIANAVAKKPVKQPTAQSALEKKSTKRPVSGQIVKSPGSGQIVKSQVATVPTATVKRRSVVLGTVVPPATTITPTIAATLPPVTTTTNASTTTSTPVTTTSKATTTSIASATAFDFDLQIPSPRVSVNMGSSTPMLVLVLPRGVPRPVDLFFADLPNGMTATGTPNPTTGGSEVRLTAASLMVPGEYQLRVMAVAGTITKFVGYTLTVLAPGAAGAGSSSGATPPSSSTTTTTTIPSGSGGFTLTVTSDGKKLKTGGTVTLTAIVTPLSNFAGSATLRVLDVPENVWVGFQQNPNAGTSSIWLSSTLTLKAGTYPILVEAKTSTQTSQIPVILTIE
jgi:hypothetical protein